MSDDKSKGPTPDEPEVEGEEGGGEDIPLDADHPILAEAIELLEQDENGIYSLPEDNAKELAEILDAMVGHIDLPVAVDALFRLAHILETEGQSPDAAKAVLLTVEREPVINALKELVEYGQSLIQDAEAEQLTATGQSFTRFSGKASAAETAPKVGEKAPKGAVSIDKFNIPRKG